MKKYLNLKAIIAQWLIVAFLLNSFGPVPTAQAQEFILPKPGILIHLSSDFNPPILKGIKVHPDNQFRFDFILDRGDGKQADAVELKRESTKLIKYFLASLTIPEKDLWVNLSPYEKNRIVPESFGQTEMGRDLLAQDYILKQITASLIYPEGESGKKFWKRIYEESFKRFGTTNIPVNTFNKVWIVPEKAEVYENAKAGTAYVVQAKLKVMLEEDYLSTIKHQSINRPQNTGSQILREIIISELTKEVNQGQNFAQLRQVYNSLILATWYKKKIKDSILVQVYENKNKVAGVGYGHSDIEAIYQRYLQAFKKGAYNYIKEQVDPVTQQIIPRKYFSGGFSAYGTINQAMYFTTDETVISGGMLKNQAMVSVNLASVHHFDHAMRSQVHQQVIDEFNSLTGVTKVVDVGTWDGSFLDDWRRLNPDTKIIGYDFRRNDNVEGYVNGDFLQSGLNDHSVDMVTVNMPFPNDYSDGTPRLLLLLKEADRILKPGGEIYIVSEAKEFVNLSLRGLRGKNYVSVVEGMLLKAYENQKYPRNTKFMSVLRQTPIYIFIMKKPLVGRKSVRDRVNGFLFKIRSHLPVDLAMINQALQARDVGIPQMSAVGVQNSIITALGIDESKLDKTQVLVDGKKIEVTRYMNSQDEAVPFLRVGRFVIINNRILTEKPELNEKIGSYRYLIRRDIGYLQNFPGNANRWEEDMSYSPYVGWSVFMIGILASLDAHADQIRQRNFIDFGAGYSGILAVAAHQLKAKRLLLYEKEPAYVKQLEWNLLNNGVPASQFTIRPEDFTNLKHLDIDGSVIFVVDLPHFGINRWRFKFVHRNIFKYASRWLGLGISSYFLPSDRLLNILDLLGTYQSIGFIAGGTNTREEKSLLEARSDFKIRGTAVIAQKYWAIGIGPDDEERDLPNKKIQHYLIHTVESKKEIAAEAAMIAPVARVLFPIMKDPVLYQRVHFLPTSGNATMKGEEEYFVSEYIAHLSQQQGVRRLKLVLGGSGGKILRATLAFRGENGFLENIPLGKKHIDELNLIFRESGVHFDGLLDLKSIVFVGTTSPESISKAIESAINRGDFLKGSFDERLARSLNGLQIKLRDLKEEGIFVKPPQTRVSVPVSFVGVKVVEEIEKRLLKLPGARLSISSTEGVSYLQATTSLMDEDEIKMIILERIPDAAMNVRAGSIQNQIIQLGFFPEYVQVKEDSMVMHFDPQVMEGDWARLVWFLNSQKALSPQWPVRSFDMNIKTGMVEVFFNGQIRSKFQDAAMNSTSDDSSNRGISTIGEAIAELKEVKGLGEDLKGMPPDSVEYTEIQNEIADMMQRAQAFADSQEGYHAIKLERSWHTYRADEYPTLEGLWQEFGIVSAIAKHEHAMINNLDPGGIDLSSDKTLTVQNNGQRIQFRMDPAQLAQLQNASGFVPVIISIDTRVNLREFLGII